MTYLILLLAWLTFAPLDPGLAPHNELGSGMDPHGQSATESDDGELGPVMDPHG